MTSFDNEQLTHSSDDGEMLQILTDMLESDETITARAVARKHPKLSHASSITRSESRSRLLEEFQGKQKQYRRISANAPRRSRDQLARQLAHKDARIGELERQIEILRCSHIAMMRAVGELGGTSKLLKMYESYREFRGELQRLGLLGSAEVKPFAAKAATAAD
jgi:hypothetical protein